MDISLQRLTQKSFDTVVKWHEDHVKINFPDSIYKPEMFLELLKKGMENKDGMWLVSKGSQDIGFLWLKIIYDPYKDYNYCDVHYVHLIPEMRDKGYGKWLLNRAVWWALDHRAKEMRLGTSADNERAIKVYKKAGYIIKRVLMEKKI